MKVLAFILLVLFLSVVIGYDGSHNYPVEAGNRDMIMVICTTCIVLAMPGNKKL